jgi:hypothetical protein
MIENYTDLHQLIASAMDTYAQSDESVSLDFEVAENQTCAMIDQSSGNKIIFMLAKFGDEFKVGYAYFSKGEREPEWIDDTFTDEFDENYVLELIKEHIVGASDWS